MNNSKKIIGITILVFALYFWYMRFDVLTHPEFYGDLLLPFILTIVGIFVLLKRTKRQ